MSGYFGWRSFAHRHRGVAGKLLLALCVSLILQGKAFADMLDIAVQGRLAGLDPHAHNETFTLGILSNVMEGLVRRDAKLRIVPGLAVRWRQLTPLHWRFHLRRGVTFHDGSPFSADDVVFSFERARRPQSQHQLRIPKGMRIEKVASHTVEFHLRTPNPVLHADWEALLIMSAAWARRHGLDNVGLGYRVGAKLPANGTGPYRVTRHRAGLETRFAANPNWWARTVSQPHFSAVTMHTVHSPQTRTAALLSGQVDLIAPVPVQDLRRIERTEGLKILTGPELRTIFLNMDQRREMLVGAPAGTKNPLRDVRVRRAIYHAIDANRIVKVIMRGGAIVASSLISPIVHPGVGLIRRLEYDPRRSRALLRAAGYPRGFELPMDCPNDRYVNDAAICTALAAMLARVGIKVRLRTQTKSLFFAKVLAGGGYDSAFNLIGWTPGALDGLNVLTNVAGCRDATGRGAYFNLGGYCNRRVDQLAAQALIELDAGRRADMITEAFRIIHADTGFIPLHQQMVAWAMSGDINATARADNQIRFDLIRRQTRRRTVLAQ